MDGPAAHSSNTDLARLPRDLLLHGRSCLAYGVVGDPSVRAFECEYGTVAFGQTWTPGGKRTLVVSDPLCSAAALPQLLRTFLRSYPGAAFFQIREATCQALAAFGYERTHLAVETSIPLQEWSPSGTKQQCFRTALNRAIRDGHEIVEARCADVGVDRLKRLSEAWMTTKRLHHREISFFSRPAIYADEPGVRKFFALRNGVPTAFVVFDPMFEAGSAFGYVGMALRQHPAATPGLCDAVILKAALQFQAEGLRELHLGMSPFCPPRERFDTLGEPALASTFVGVNWTLLNVLFNHQGIAGHKRRWRAVETPVYYAGQKNRSLFDFIAAARLTGLLP